MKLSVSSIAWTADEEVKIAEYLQSVKVKAVELAPTKIWDDPTSATIQEIEEVCRWWRQYDIEIVAFQSMLFSRPDLKIFESAECRKQCTEYLKAFTILAGKMGVKKMVFGSPKNRQRGEMSYEDAFLIARDFFSELAEVAYANDVVFCVEPNAPQYACDFITTAAEGAELVRSVNHPGFGLHLDTACMTLAGDDMSVAIQKNADILNHFHISSPMLGEVKQDTEVDHNEAADALGYVGYDKVVSIEMRPGEEGSNLERVKSAVSFAQATYF